jgi:8-oxo-dGTP pyrophosphatase MutT (NUDIX family)
MKPLIRPLALALIVHEGRLLVAVGTDRVTRQGFYRLLGGGIEFGETGAQTLRRELHEEIGAQAARVSYLDTLENIFIYEGEAGHEICRVYLVEVEPRELYDAEEIPLLDTDAVARWVPLDAFMAGGERLYPDGSDELLQRQVTFMEQAG